MGLINQQDRRPRDWTYLAKFDRKDLPSLQEMAQHIRETHDTAMIEDFNQKCEQKLKGESGILDNGLEIKTVAKSGDLVVTTGLRHCLNIILGTVSTRWSHFGMGSGSSVAAITDTALNSETVSERVSFAWAEPVGMRLLFGGISGQTQAAGGPGGVTDTGVYNGAAAGAVLLNHSYVYNPPLNQALGGFSNVYTAPIVLSAVIEFCPVA